MIMSYRNLDLSLLRTFSTVVESGSVTASARRLNVSQPAVSQQLRRLEELVQKPLFKAIRRPSDLTSEGEILLGYCRAILRLNDEALSRFARPEVTGRIVLGSPDLYASFFLPDILADFGRAYPTVQIDLRCALTVPLLKDYAAGRMDLVLATQMPDNIPGRFLRAEPLHFVTGESSTAHSRSPLPLAMLPPGNLYRDHAIAALEAHGRPWRIACESESIAGLLASVQAGLAITVLTRPAVGAGLRICSGFDGVPALPSVDLVLYHEFSETNEPAGHLADYLITRLA
ncbi:MAG TPA: LysR family transcriptional regulator [Rhodospirillaceae bacterium]|nr:LysR family transcriptional regulator [Rhodospirillaceae bacterium]MAX64922.1 LysR family transcriptional regulator [Rhodospirillaceae bacterium]MBB57155.1 LysR family transcriptional regulator [Rhodospirillaceae bacterium]HAJ18619.1 LysR family transcriptional regulator [Rhodospirillaceae bacterium]HBM14293.1 LysR family transcriptional regulator [Rhodospirillaceae bacterium]|tara:strand:+ start:548 stop:1408 length:861 start_codon:yes stop_codon:yes gene_type:complete